ncbi:hypothetical protein [Chryseobacterium gambrini]|uniref:Uncharacterized protein n=1 Tax=Chryseobacterium gambrini TaxID=373672 RepID=A0A1N7NYI3_9FLAO|nr:hypothetical protein [Chryseobacterium gambrini]SIT03415.1 hypothetical protein SAMN05421785_105221 [Chryseobacterium gambrini]
MKTLFAVVITIIMVITHKVSAQQPAIFTMDRIWCNETTENGEDEVYLIELVNT